MQRILIIGATGTIGREVLFQSTAKGVQVRAMSRNPEQAQCPPAVEVVRGDLTAPETLDACLNGVDAVFLVFTAPASAVVPALARITRCARRVVFLTSPHKTPHPFFQQPNPMQKLHADIESVIEASPCEWTFLRPGMFAANCLGWWAPQIRAGQLVRWPYLAAPTAPTDERDIAAVAVRALSEDGHAGANYVITGPQSLTQSEQIAVIGHAIRRSIRVEEMSPDEARRDGLPTIPAPAVNMLLNAWSAALGQPAFVTTTVKHVTGVPPRSFHDWAADHASEFRA